MRHGQEVDHWYLLLVVRRPLLPMRSRPGLSNEVQLAAVVGQASPQGVLSTHTLLHYLAVVIRGTMVKTTMDSKPVLNKRNLLARMSNPSKE